jgi:hypothetical protein
MPLTFTLGGRCCDKDAAKFYFNTLSSSGELSIERGDAMFAPIRAFPLVMTHAEFVSRSQYRFCGANTLRSATSTNTGT